VLERAIWKGVVQLSILGVLVLDVEFTQVDCAAGIDVVRPVEPTALNGRPVHESRGQSSARSGHHENPCYDPRGFNLAAAGDLGVKKRKPNFLAPAVLNENNLPNR